MISVATTGPSPQRHRIVEVAVVTTDLQGTIDDEWTSRIDSFADVAGDLSSRLAGAVVVAHNAEFDLSFVRSGFRRAGWELPQVPTLSTLEASTYHLPNLERRRLRDCCSALGIPLANKPSVLDEARATAALLATFMNPDSGAPPLPEHLDLPARAQKVSWPSGPTQPSTPDPAAPAEEPSSGGPALADLVDRFSLLDAQDEGAPIEALAYLEKLAEVMEDGEITTREAADLAQVAAAEELTPDDITRANEAFVRALAQAAPNPVSEHEREELLMAADLLHVNSRLVPEILAAAENARIERLSAGLADLPGDWDLGEPLRVGDKVVFTGCDPEIRADLETRSQSLGVRVLGAVSRKTAMLVSDNSVDGLRAARARELGTRTVTPEEYARLLTHLQPAEPQIVQLQAVTSKAAGSAVDGSSAAEAVAADPVAAAPVVPGSVADGSAVVGSLAAGVPAVGSATDPVAANPVAANPGAAEPLVAQSAAKGPTADRVGSVVPESVVPESVVPESVVPDAVASESVASESVASESVASESVASESVASESVAAESAAADSKAADSKAAGSVAAGSVTVDAAIAGSAAAGSVAAGSVAPKPASVEPVVTQPEFVRGKSAGTDSVTEQPAGVRSSVSTVRAADSAVAEQVSAAAKPKPVAVDAPAADSVEAGAAESKLVVAKSVALESVAVESVVASPVAGDHLAPVNARVGDSGAVPGEEPVAVSAQQVAPVRKPRVASTRKPRTSVPKVPGVKEAADESPAAKPAASKAAAPKSATKKTTPSKTAPSKTTPSKTAAASKTAAPKTALSKTAATKAAAIKTAATKTAATKTAATKTAVRKTAAAKSTETPKTRSSAGKPAAVDPEPSTTSALPTERTPKSTETPKAADVRAWARANGREVSVRGGLPKELIAAYLAARAED